MPPAFRFARLGCLFLAISGLGGCSLHDWLPHQSETTIANSTAIDHALRLCALSRGGRPFHLALEVEPPEHAYAAMHARIEIFWLNLITYRVVIHSPGFSQLRIVNGGTVEEHDFGAFYPRWIQNFVDAILDPAPQAAALSKIPGTIPVGPHTNACISNTYPPGSTPTGPSDARICFADSDPKLSSDLDFTRYVSFDDFAPFGSQQIARTLVDDLSTSILLRGHITLLEPLSPASYSLLKATEFTAPAQQIQTTLVSTDTAEALLENSATPLSPQTNPQANTEPGKPAAAPPSIPARPQPSTQEMAATIYIRTDRTGQVREAYHDSSDFYGSENASVAHALTLKFKPLVLNGVPQQMEAPLPLYLADNKKPAP